MCNVDALLIVICWDKIVFLLSIYHLCRLALTTLRNPDTVTASNSLRDLGIHVTMSASGIAVALQNMYLPKPVIYHVTLIAIFG